MPNQNSLRFICAACVFGVEGALVFNKKAFYKTLAYGAVAGAPWNNNEISFGKVNGTFVKFNVKLSFYAVKTSSEFSCT